MENEIMRKCKVYLAGLISTDYPESLEWRREVTEELSDGFERLEFLDPVSCHGGMLHKQTRDGGITADDTTSADIVLKDYMSVKAADVVLANLNTFGATRPLVGTLFELAWCYDWRKPVIGILNEDSYLMRNHPFVRESVTHYFTEKEPALDHIATFYAAAL